MTKNEIKAYYDRVFEEEGLEAYRKKEAYRPYLEMLNLEGSETLLDIGCGSGHLLKLAEETGLNPYGIDISEEAITLCREYIPSGVFEASPGEDIPFKSDQFDVVTCIGVLEHTEHPEKVLEEVKRVGKEDSTILFVVPNRNFLFWKLTDEGTEQQEVQEELRSWTGWEELFQSNGFNIVRVRRDAWHMKFRGWKKRAAKAVNYIIPIRLNYQFAVLMEIDDG